MPISSTEDRVNVAGVGSRPELRAMLTVSRAVAEGGPLHQLLDRIASEAAGVVEGADRSSISDTVARTASVTCRLYIGVRLR